jgi:hypothetical protein
MWGLPNSPTSWLAFSGEVWFSILHPLGLQAVMPDSNSRLATWWFQSRKQVDKSGCNGFNCLVLLVIWLLWKERNQQFSVQLSHFGTEDQGWDQIVDSSRIP